MKAFRKYFSLIVLAFVMLAGSSCSKIHEISVTSYKIKSINPKGLRSVDATIDLGIHNPTLQFTLVNNKAVIYHQGTEIGTVVADDVTVEAKTDAVYPISGNVTLADGIGIFKVMSLAKNFNEEEYTLDIDTDIKLKSGATFKVRKRDMPLTELTK